jgi:hypothetical protein
MSYTNFELVRAHLGGSFPGRDRVVDRQITLTADDLIVFHDTAVDDASLTVKSDISSRISRASLTFINGRAQTGVSPLVVGSVVIATDSSLGTVYSENADYVVDYASGEIRLISGGSIADSQSVSIWYDIYTVYTPGIDYVFDSQRAAVKRLSTGAIGDGQRVLVDFTPLDREINESIIIAAVTEANAKVEREIDPDGQYGADATLQGAATCRALETLCRASAMQELRRHFADDKIAQAWLKLAEQMAVRSAELIRTFRKPFAGPKAADKT